MSPADRRAQPGRLRSGFSRSQPNPRLVRGNGMRLRLIQRTVIALIRAGALLVATFGTRPLWASSTLTLSSDGVTVYDTANGITWLANGNLAASNRFGLPFCTVTSSPTACVNPSGSMNWVGATAWVAAMNNANYLGHSDWQLPTSPLLDKGCSNKGPQNDWFGYNCALNALGSLYYEGLGLVAPNSAVPIAPNRVGPFTNFQPYFYWSQSGDGGDGFSVFSFGSGSQGGNTSDNFQNVLPMVLGQIAGSPGSSGSGIQVNPGGQSVYDPIAGVTWVADANLAATNSFGLLKCATLSAATVCVAANGTMNMASANQLIINMNSYNGVGYLGQTNWQLPISLATCPTYGCADSRNPMGILYYTQLGLAAATPVVPTVNLAAGPFRNLQPYYYWSCQAGTVQEPCESEGPNSTSEWSFSFNTGFLGTDRLEADYYVLPYFVGAGTPTGGPIQKCNLTANPGLTVSDVQQMIDEALGAASAIDDLNGDGLVDVIDILLEENAVITGRCVV